MRSALEKTRGIPIPNQEVALYLALGWVLTDEPSCGYARMMPPPCRHPHEAAEGRADDS